MDQNANRKVLSCIVFWLKNRNEKFRSFRTKPEPESTTMINHQLATIECWRSRAFGKSQLKPLDILFGFKYGYPHHQIFVSTILGQIHGLCFWFLIYYVSNPLIGLHLFRSILTTIIYVRINLLWGTSFMNGLTCRSH